MDSWPIFAEMAGFFSDLLSIVIYPKRHDSVCSSDLTTPLLGDGCLKP
jgi:hypothetical protein